jgi:hypothetical protein
MYPKEQLITYSREMGLSHMLTLENLIESHKVLRAYRMEFEGNLQQARKEAYAKSFEFHTESFKGKDMVDIDELRGMTLDEIIERITSGN